jgi:muconolactone delta-isomerase
MSMFKVRLTINMEDGTQDETVQDVEANTAEEAKKLVYDAWIKFLYQETEAYRYVKNSGIVAEPVKGLGQFIEPHQGGDLKPFLEAQG